MSTILKEITPLTTRDCFTIFSRTKSEFDFPLHYHEEFELNFIANAKGARRIIGDHEEEINDIELVLVGSNLPHAWETNKCKSRRIQEITIQFHKDLFDEKMLRRNQMYLIREMFDKSRQGILFPKETARKLKEPIQQLCSRQGFDSVLELMSILHDLSLSRNIRILSDISFSNPHPPHVSDRIIKVTEYLNMNFNKQVLLADAAKLTNMTEVSFSRFFKTHTGISFIDNLIEIRLGHASRLLVETSQAVADVAHNCGFNNISNFNRIFKKKKGCTPKEFRDNYNYSSRVFI